MINSFADSETELIYNGNVSRKLPPTIQNTARRKLRMIAAAKVIEDLKGFYSIRINDQWQIKFKFDNGGAENVKIEDYH